MTDPNREVFHFFSRTHLTDPKAGLYCACTYKSTKSLFTEGLKHETSNHMIGAGLCPECWGGGTVCQRATYDRFGTLMAGNVIDCPVCGGSGKFTDVNYSGVNPNSYFNRLEMMEVDEALRVLKERMR